MTDRPSSPDVLRDWARMPIPLDSTDADSERRARLVNQLARSIRETHGAQQRRRRVGRVAAILALAAAVVLAIGLSRALAPRARTASASVEASSPGVLVAHGAESRAVDSKENQGLSLGDVVRTAADAHARLRLVSGAEADVEPSTRVTLARSAPGEEQLELGIGEISVRVPRLGPSASFRVSTPDAVVVVHGTAFVVRVEKATGGDGTVTTVSVREGRVSVERNGSQVFLSPGQSWSSAGAPEAAAAPEPKAEKASSEAAPEPASAPAARPLAAPVAPKTAALAATTADPSDLAEQNRLFSAAAAARHRGDDRGAVGYLNQLISRYPSGPLTPEARVERFRALKRLGQDEEAAREARRYLLEHQGGAARDEARGVALEPKSK